MKYNGKEVKLIKEYNTFVLVEHLEGYRECISKHDLGLIQEKYKPMHEGRLRGITGLKV